MNYTIYAPDGRILKTVGTSDIEAQLEFGNAYIHGIYSDTAFYVDAGAPIAMPPRPSDYHVFDYTTKQWVDPRTPETEWPLVRAKRNQLLQASDWTQLPDVPLATKDAWAAYRQAMRDVTGQPDPFNIVWPTPPA